MTTNTVLNITVLEVVMAWFLQEHRILTAGVDSGCNQRRSSFFALRVVLFETVYSSIMQ